MMAFHLIRARAHKSLAKGLLLVLCFFISTSLVSAQTVSPVAATETSKAQQIEDARYKSLAQELRCLVCQNQSIADSAADLALDLKREIREQIQTGKTDAEISAYMVERYGDFVLYRPPFKWLTVILWVAPVLLLLLALWALRRKIMRNGQSVASTTSSPAVNAPQPSAANTPASDEVTKIPDDSASQSSLNQKSSSRNLYVLAGLAILVSVAIYVVLGTPKTENTAAQNASSPSDPNAASSGVSAEQIQSMVTRLAERLKTQPEDTAGWLRLARSYSVMERYADAIKAYAEVEKRSPDLLRKDPQALLDFAKCLAISGNGYQGKAASLVEQALKIAPDEPNVLLIAGLAAAQQGKKAQARQHWGKLLPLIPPGHELETMIKNALAKLEQSQ
jgi:cytochrome c-type biogenesis protein CcmH